MNKLMLHLCILIILSNTCLGQQRFKIFTIKYPPCSQELQLIVKPDSLIIFKDSLVNNYCINLNIQVVNASDSSINLNGLGSFGFGPDTIVTGLYSLGKGISYQIFDAQDSTIIMESYLAEKAVDDELENYRYGIEKELKYLDSLIAKNDSNLVNNEKHASEILLKPKEKYSFNSPIYLHTVFESKLSISEDYYNFEKNSIYNLIVYYSNEQFFLVEKSKLKYCAFSNPITLIIK